jgi:hypothetical protein
MEFYILQFLFIKKWGTTLASPSKRCIRPPFISFIHKTGKARVKEEGCDRLGEPT